MTLSSAFRAMRAVSLAVAAWLLSFNAAALEPRPVSPYPRDAIILFVAAWCAPCRGEISRIDSLMQEAAPRRLMVFPVDEGGRSAAMLRDVPARAVWRLPADEAARVRQDLFRRTAGLPYSLATDAQGRPCAATSRGLDAASLRLMKRECAR